MPSSLIFAGLVVAWLLILVPMIARRRQEVVRPSEAALACRVLDRPAATRRSEEVTEVAELDGKAGIRDEPAAAEEPETATEAWAPESADPGELSPRFRPGRGGFDPEAAALAAGARYAFRQRVVLALLLGAMATALIAFFGLPTVWWLHGLLDLVLLVYLAQLRRQVRIEEEIRHRRAARMAGTRRPPPSARTQVDAGSEPPAGRTEQDGPQAPSASDDRAGDEPGTAGSDAGHESAPTDSAEPEQPGLPPLQPTPQPQRPVGTAVVELDDEDPELDQLDVPERRYRRAVGE